MDLWTPCVLTARMSDKICLAWSNLDFEHDLAGHLRPTPLLEELCRRWRFILRLLPEARQATCLSDPSGLAPGSVDKLLCWGASPRAQKLARALGCSLPPLEVVRRVNSKLFSHSLERSAGLALPGATPVESLEQLLQSVESCPYDWVLKHPLGWSGRQRVLGKAGLLSDSSKGWARRHFLAGQCLLFEPWAYQRRDFSYHFEIGSEVTYLGYCEMLEDPSGVFRGHRVGADQPRAPEIYTWIVQQLQRVGYWGWVGIDGFSGSLGSTRVERPLVEINARCSFGRLALALRPWVPTGWEYLWWHPAPSQAERLQALEAPPLTSVQHPGLYRLPEWADPGGISRTRLILAPDRPSLEDLEGELYTATLG